MKKLIVCLLAISALLCLASCDTSKKEPPSVVDGYFTFIQLEDGTYCVTATDVNDFPEEVTIPASYDGIPVTAIADNAFSACPTLRKITVPDTISRLPSGAFYRCPNLEAIVLPKTITGIGKGAIGLCEQEITIYFDGTVEEWQNILKAGNWDVETKCYVSCTDGRAD